MSADDAELRIHSRLAIPRRELHVSFARSGGPGGQNVNKVETKVILRFDVLGSPTLSEGQRQRIARALASRITAKGELVVRASRHRDQSKNREEARERLAELLRDALRTRRPRVRTRPTRGSVERRLTSKRQRAETKRRRGGGGWE